jgi:hypothetical protein
MDNISDFVRQLFRALPTAAISRFMSTLDRHGTPMHSQTDRRKGGQFARKLKALQLYGHLVPCGSVYRQAFLWGTANYLKGFGHEELILGFGVARGYSTCINSVMKLRGDRKRVELPQEKAVMIHDFLNRNGRHTVLLVHNHPDHLIASLLAFVFGDAPMPSMTDRDFALSIVLRRFESINQGCALGKIRFYLIQNDAISEFSGITPALVVDALRVACEDYQARENLETTAASAHHGDSRIIIGEGTQRNVQESI